MTLEMLKGLLAVIALVHGFAAGGAEPADQCGIF